MLISKDLSCEGMSCQLSKSEFFSLSTRCKIFLSNNRLREIIFLFMQNYVYCSCFLSLPKTILVELFQEYIWCFLLYIWWFLLRFYRSDEIYSTLILVFCEMSAICYNLNETLCFFRKINGFIKHTLNMQYFFFISNKLFSVVWRLRLYFRSLTRMMDQRVEELLKVLIME